MYGERTYFLSLIEGRMHNIKKQFKEIQFESVYGSLDITSNRFFYVTALFPARRYCESSVTSAYLRSLTSPMDF